MYSKRQYCIDKFSGIFNLDIANALIQNLEKGIFNSTIKYCNYLKVELNWTNPHFFKKYAQLARKVIANLTYTPNANYVKQKILNQEWLPENIATMTHAELNPIISNEVRQKILKKSVPITKPIEQENDGLFTCFKCRSKKTVYAQAQTRSADEPMTTFVTCLKCNNIWKC